MCTTPLILTALALLAKLPHSTLLALWVRQHCMTHCITPSSSVLLALPNTVVICPMPMVWLQMLDELMIVSGLMASLVTGSGAWALYVFG